jgi:hypothetical protein
MPDNSCSVIGGDGAPIEITIWEANSDGTHGRQLFHGTLNSGDPIGPWSTAHGRVVYQYRSLTDGTLSGDTYFSCIDRNQISLPL